MITAGDYVIWRLEIDGEAIDLHGRVRRMFGTGRAECAFDGCDVLITVPTVDLAPSNIVPFRPRSTPTHTLHAGGPSGAA